jgi:hypothetical protein
MQANQSALAQLISAHESTHGYGLQALMNKRRRPRGVLGPLGNVSENAARQVARRFNPLRICPLLMKLEK